MSDGEVIEAGELARKLEAFVPADGDRRALIAGVLAELERAPDPLAGAESLNVSLNEPGVYYAVHEGDLELLKECMAAGLGFAAVISAPWGAIAGLVMLMFKYRKKRVRLDADQAAVLRALIDGGEQEVAKLAQRPELARLGAEKIAALLAELHDAVRHDGTSTELAAERNGKWRAVDV